MVFHCRLSSHLLLHSVKPNAGPSCSKAPRGLFVLAYLGRVFTAISISPGQSSRQFSSRSAFRAGRNLPDKEFRYLSTVIVTADVYRGFDRKLAPPYLTLRHWSGVRPYTSPFRFAEPCVFDKQSLESHSLRPRYNRGTTSSKDTSSFFAEFLEDRSPVHLSILYLPTCVGLRYG